MPQISDAELEVMKILWETGDTTSTQIIDRISETSDWKPKTIHTLIARLVDKKAISAKKIDGKSYLYSANVAEEDYKSHASKSFLKQLFNGSINLMVANYVKEQKLTKKEIDELKKLLDEEV
jgi:Predicted transcriptional regulator